MTDPIHVGLPVRCAGTIEVGNHIHINHDTFIVTKVGGAAFDMIPKRENTDD